MSINEIIERIEKYDEISINELEKAMVEIEKEERKRKFKKAKERVMNRNIEAFKELADK